MQTAKILRALREKLEKKKESIVERGVEGIDERNDLESSIRTLDILCRITPEKPEKNIFAIEKSGLQGNALVIFFLMCASIKKKNFLSENENDEFNINYKMLVELVKRELEEEGKLSEKGEYCYRP